MPQPLTGVQLAWLDSVLCPEMSADSGFSAYKPNIINNLVSSWPDKDRHPRTSVDKTDVQRVIPELFWTIYDNFSASVGGERGYLSSTTTTSVGTSERLLAWWRTDDVSQDTSPAVCAAWLSLPLSSQ